MQAALAWGVCGIPGATVTIACDCDQDDAQAPAGRAGVGLFGTVVYLAAAAIVGAGILRGAGVL